MSSRANSTASVAPAPFAESSGDSPTSRADAVLRAFLAEQELEEMRNSDSVGPTRTNGTVYANSEQNVVSLNGQTQWPYQHGTNANPVSDPSAFPQFVEQGPKGGALLPSNQSTAMTRPTLSANVELSSTGSVQSHSAENKQRQNKRKRREDNEVQPGASTICSFVPAHSLSSLNSAPHTYYPPYGTLHDPTPISAPNTFTQGPPTASGGTPAAPDPGSRPGPYKFENNRWICTYIGPASKDPNAECGKVIKARDTGGARDRHLAIHAEKEERLLVDKLITKDQTVAMGMATKKTVTCRKPNCGFSVQVWRTDGVRQEHNSACHPAAAPPPHPWAGAELTVWEAAQLRQMCQSLAERAERLGFVEKN